jgi:hypothetical protein
LVTAVITFLSEKVVAVVITTVVVVAAVPTFILAINGNTITITPGPVASTTRHGDDEERNRIVVEIKTTGDNVILKLTSLEASCDSQIQLLASQSKLAASATQAALDTGKSQLHASVEPFIDEIKADEDEIQRLTVITTETEQAFVVRINTVKVLALGEDDQHGAVVTVCQTILVEIRQVIVVVTVNPGGGDRDSDIKKP